MSDSTALIAAMANQCREMILAWDQPSLDMHTSLQPKHLQWMCHEIVHHAGDWPVTKLHRWLGFVQGAMIANTAT